MPKKKTRLAVYAVVAIAALTVAGVDQADPTVTAHWVDQAAKLAGAVSGVLAMLNLKDDAPQAPPAE